MEIIIPYPPEKSLPGKRMIQAQRRNADIFQDKLTNYQDEVMNLVLKKNMPPIDGPVAIEITVRRPDSRPRMLGNFIKPVIEALEGFAYCDKTQVEQIMLERGSVDAPNGSLHIAVKKVKNGLVEGGK
jgi:hypothetical protein